MRDNVNHPGQADSACRFIPEESAQGQEIQNILVKNRQYKKLTQTDIVAEMKNLGYRNFNNYAHQQFWQNKWKNASERNKKATKFGELVVGTQWLWFKETWLPEVKAYCASVENQFK